MDALSSVFTWLSDHEAGISAVVGIAVLAGIVLAGLRSLVRRRAQTPRAESPSATTEPALATDSEPADLDPMTVPGFEGRPAIAVLPFDNLSVDPEQEYFADGIAEDLITLLSAWRDFPVIARNSSFTYKGRAVDVKQVSRELGVRYVVEGSVRKAGDRLRITAQLIDATTGGHVWAERYDRELEDIFTIQDEITAAIAGAMGAKLAVTEEARAAQKSPASVTAYDLLMRGRHCHAQRAWEEDFDEMQAEARSCFERAIEINPRSAAAFAWLAMTHWAAWYSPGIAPAQSPEEMERAARRSVSLDPELPMAHLALGIAHQFRGEYMDAIASARHAIELDPSFARAYRILGWFLASSGKPDEGIEAIEKGMRLSPRDPSLFLFLAAKGWAHFVARRYEVAVECLKQSLELTQPPTAHNWFILAASLAHLDRHEEAAATLREVSTRYERKLSLSDTRQTYRFEDSDLLERFLDGLRKAGMKE
jgi:adenylate cyclase